MTRFKNRCPSHPGALLREDILPSIDHSKADVARMLGISRQHLYDIIREKKPVSPEVAVRLAKLFGGSAISWVRMQGAYDAWHAERTVDVSDIQPLQAA
ncbi:HigA family addiction module antitoxin [Phaeobacter sp. 22II1-1F12B]|uniref:HigA family addiction module antitoxin n=1 Tax=Phaeobacter sp. 22II1-1F12B TaxID=1317111 RepID=UPI000B52284B|nr:HigA family addiction module antitoxin [Phaeobacter sp. 22II1-1F12B]OWU80412.1 HigA family addiction module antidote protein [Phaeobacter sp. 22II1-1F12B]